LRPLTRNNELRVVPSWPRGEGSHQGKTNVKTPRFREQDIPIAITTLIQVLVLQLIDSEVLTVEQAEQVFDGAAKRSARLKDVAPSPDQPDRQIFSERRRDEFELTKTR
jgi:hypothetical protein